MNIMVYDVAAESGGATSILNYFYEKHKSDTENHYYYMLSTYHLEETSNITIINVPEIKQGWGSRLLFDLIGVRKYIKEYKIDCVFSLQNIGIPFFKGTQVVYEHNALPFVEYRFSLKEDKLMWVYQNVLGHLMLSSIKRADKVYVQTEWMGEEIAKRVPSARSKIEVEFPAVTIPERYKYHRIDENIFFYPANGSKFKNHEVIIDACLALKELNIVNYEVVFTLNGDESDYIKMLQRIAVNNNLPVRWVGILPREQVFEWYEKSALLFPSYIETIGLPIYEALSIEAPVILSDCKYARNVAGGYKKAYFFDYKDKNQLSKYMKKYIEKTLE